MVAILRDNQHVITIQFKTQIDALKDQLSNFKLYVNALVGCGNTVAGDILQYYMNAYQS